MQRTLYFISALCCVLAMNGCSETEEPELTTTQTPVVNETSVVLATIGDNSVTQASIDQSIQLKLYELEWAKYELRRAALTKRVKFELDRGGNKSEMVQVLLIPPTPPRLRVDAGKQPFFGPDDAPVVLSIFCNYQSSHCGKMQAPYQDLLTLYPEQLKFVFYDFPQGYHRYAIPASNAARCAEREGKFWPYHKALWAHQNDLNNERYLRISAQLEMNQEGFLTCLNEHPYVAAIRDNIAMAESFGFSNAPVTLINGLYLKGPKSSDTLRYFIDQELAQKRLTNNVVQNLANSDVDSDAAIAITKSKLPLRLEGIVNDRSEKNKQALIRHLDTNSSAGYRQDESIVKGVFLVMIEASRVIIENQGVLEFLPLNGDALVVTMTNREELLSSDEAGRAFSTKSVGGRSTTLESNAEAPVAGLEYTPRGVIAAKGETPLSRAWLEGHLMNESVLREHFQPAEHEVEGVHVMRLSNVASNDFYQTLGLEEGDVILRVNDEWVHEAQNNLFAVLSDEQEVSLVLMRRGLPVHLRYAIN